MQNLNRADYDVRDALLFGAYEPEKYLGGIRSFSNVDAETLRELIDWNFADPDDVQNCAPSLGEFLDELSANPKWRVHGYAVSPDRDDYRISIEGVCAKGEFTPEEQLDFALTFRFADELSVSDDYLRCWYD